MSLIIETCRLLGIDPWRQFWIRGCDNLLEIDGSDGSVILYNSEKEKSKYTLLDLLNHPELIIDVSWKPTYDDEYWTINSSNNVVKHIWLDRDCEKNLYWKGLIFRSINDAESFLLTKLKKQMRTA